jgi:hypothetical protein
LNAWCKKVVGWITTQAGAFRTMEKDNYHTINKLPVIVELDEYGKTSTILFKLVQRFFHGKSPFHTESDALSVKAVFDYANNTAHSVLLDRRLIPAHHFQFFVALCFGFWFLSMVFSCKSVIHSLKIVMFVTTHN